VVKIVFALPTVDLKDLHFSAQYIHVFLRFSRPIAISSRVRILAKSVYYLLHILLYVRTAATGRIYMKSDIAVFYEN
jgi:hypothetical protein